MLGSTLWWRFMAFTLWLFQWSVVPLVSADGFIAFPPEQFVQRASGGGGLRGPQPPQLKANDRSGSVPASTLSSKTSNSKKSKNGNESTSASSSSSLKRLIDESIPDCGESRVDIPPIDVAHADTFQWRSANAGYNKPSKGPCEIWIGSNRVFEGQDCAKIFPNELGTIKFDYSPCRGTCLLTFYWLETGADNSESKPTKHCVPIRNDKNPESDSGSKSTSGSGSSSSSSSSSSGSGSGSGSNAKSSSKCLVSIDDLRALDALSKLYGAVHGSGTRRAAPAPKPRITHHKLFEPLTPKWRQRPLVAVPEPYFGGYGYSATHTKSATQQCKYAPNGDFTCSSTESITDNFQPYGGDGGDNCDLSDVAHHSAAAELSQ